MHALLRSPKLSRPYCLAAQLEVSAIQHARNNHKQTYSSRNTGALKGLRVLDFTRVLAVSLESIPEHFDHSHF